MKYLLLIPDGMADWEVEELDNRTPLEVAETENMDFLAKEGACGMAKTVPEGFEPGSDVANLTILGVDVRKHYTGRGPIEALARGVNGELVFRCNLVKVEDGAIEVVNQRIDRPVHSCYLILATRGEFEAIIDLTDTHTL